MFVVYVVASCVRLIGRRSSGWSVISTSSLFFLSLRFFCCWHCCREKRPRSSFCDWAAEGKKKKSCGAPERGSVQRESHKTHKKRPKNSDILIDKRQLNGPRLVFRRAFSITWCAGMNIIMQDDAREQSSACVSPLPSDSFASLKCNSDVCIMITYSWLPSVFSLRSEQQNPKMYYLHFLCILCWNRCPLQWLIVIWLMKRPHNLSSAFLIC